MLLLLCAKLLNRRLVNNIFVYFGCEYLHSFMITSVSHLYYQYVILGHIRMYPDMHYLVLVFIPELIKPKTVLFCVNYFSG